MDSSPSTTKASLLRISRSGFINRYHMKLPATIARLAELTGEVACTRSDGLSEHVVASTVWRMIAAAVRIRELVRLWAQEEIFAVDLLHRDKRKGVGSP